MNFADYQSRTAETAIYPGAGTGNFVYPALGLNGEAGEVAEQVKKTLRDDHGEITATRRGSLIREMGDVLWYVSQLATELKLNLDDVAKTNLDMLASRKERGVLQGSGSDR